MDDRTGLGTPLRAVADKLGLKEQFASPASHFALGLAST